MIRDTRIVHGLNRPFLERLSQSDNQHFRQVATKFLELKSANERMTAIKNSSKSPDELFAEIEPLTPTALVDPSIIRDSFNKIVHEKYGNESKQSLLAVIVMQGYNSIREAVQADFRSSATGKGKPPLDSRSIPTSLRLNASGVCAIMLRNDTGSDLHNCFIATHMKTDQAIMDRYCA